jgi:hypothetical protein
MAAGQKLGDILVQLKVLSRADVDRVLQAMRRRQQRQKFGQTAQAMGLVTEEHILAALAVQMDLFPGIGRLNLAQVLSQLHSGTM